MNKLSAAMGFEESAHPRGEHGRFSSKNSSKSVDVDNEPKRFRKKALISDLYREGVNVHPKSGTYESHGSITTQPWIAEHGSGKSHDLHVSLSSGQIAGFKKNGKSAEHMADVHSRQIKAASSVLQKHGIEHHVSQHSPISSTLHLHTPGSYHHELKKHKSK